MLSLRRMVRQEARQQLDRRTRRAALQSPQLDMPCAERNQIHPHPAYSVDVAGALVARIQCRGAIAVVDAPYVEEAVVGIAQTREVLRIGAEGDAFDAEGVVAEGCEGNVRRCFFRCRED